MAETSAQPATRGGRQGEPRYGRLTWLLFVSFILLSVSLIGLVWRENLAGEKAGTPGYYRDTFVVDEQLYATVTAEAASREPLLTPTP